MTRAIDDPEVQALANLSGTMQVDYAAADMPWIGSPFAWIKARPSRQIGAIGERLVAGYLATKGFDVTKATSSQCDRIVEGRKVEIKFSTLWASGVYKFQQLRDQEYELAICLGISPFDAHCWVLGKAEILRRWRDRDGIEPQHAGAAGSDTAWLSVNPANPPQWLRECGGRLSTAVSVLGSLTGFRPVLE